MAILVAFVVGLIFLFGVKSYHYCDFERNLEMNWVRSENYVPCCEISADQWKFIKWYFARVGSHIDVSQFVREVDTGASFTNQFLVDLHEHTGLEIRNYGVNYSQIDEFVDSNVHIRKFFELHPEYSADGNSTYFVRDQKLEVRRNIFQQNWIREDKPSKGMVVLATDIDIIDHFLNRVDQQPFVAKRAFYIIIIYKEPNHDVNWDQLASSILSKLWKVHGILHAIIFSTCHNANVSKKCLYLMEFIEKNQTKNVRSNVFFV